MLWEEERVKESIRMRELKGGFFVWGIKSDKIGGDHDSMIAKNCDVGYNEFKGWRKQEKRG